MKALMVAGVSVASKKFMACVLADNLAMRKILDKYGAHWQGGHRCGDDGDRRPEIRDVRLPAALRTASAMSRAAELRGAGLT